MKCTKCEKENIYNANYCKYCKNQFSDKEREDARSKTLIGKLEKLEKIKEIISLDFIFGNTIFKIVSLIVVFLIGFILNLTIGNNLKILKSKEYTVQYDKTNDAYYLITESDTINLKLYVPNKIKELTSSEVDSDGQITNTLKIEKNSSIALNVKGEDEYYLFNTNKEKEKLKIYVYKVNE